ncbi:MAG: DegV family protein [Gracilibacteraceae bacterium]|jgi:DegV family protein with EDD domain|nr:DegV family protein [Gracilibacteraceae bacterium]
MAVKIVCDSTCDLDKSWTEAHGLIIVPLKVVFGTEQYADGVTLSKEQFYEKLTSGKVLPTTSQVAPGEFNDLFAAILSAGDDIVFLSLSAHISGTFQSAEFAKNALGSERIHLFDSYSATCGLALMARIAVQLRDEGLPAAEILARLESLRPKLRMWISLDTLHYLKLGGRLPASSAFIGELLNIKPILTLENGKVTLMEKKRSLTKAFEWTAAKIHSTGLNRDYPVCFGHSNAPQALDSLIRQLGLSGIAFSDPLTVVIGAVIATHTGPGAAALAYIEQ